MGRKMSHQRCRRIRPRRRAGRRRRSCRRAWSSCPAWSQMAAAAYRSRSRRVRHSGSVRSRACRRPSRRLRAPQSCRRPPGHSTSPCAAQRRSKSSDMSCEPRVREAPSVQTRTSSERSDSCRCRIQGRIGRTPRSSRERLKAMSSPNQHESTRGESSPDQWRERRRCCRETQSCPCRSQAAATVHGNTLSISADR